MKLIFFNPVAVADLDEIVGYIAQDNPVAAEAVRQDILETPNSPQNRFTDTWSSTVSRSRSAHGSQGNISGGLGSIARDPSWRG